MTAAALLGLAAVQAMIDMSPGPAGFLTIRTAAAAGTRAGLALALGLALAIVLWAVTALAGLSVVFALAPWLQTGLRLAGAAFLIWIGISMWRDAARPPPAVAAARTRSLTATVRLGVWTNLANPKALAYFTAVFSGLVPADAGAADAAAILAVIFAVELGWYAALALVFSRPAPRRAYARARGWLERVFGALLAGFGARLAAS